MAVGGLLGHLFGLLGGGFGLLLGGLGSLLLFGSLGLRRGLFGGFGGLVELLGGVFEGLSHLGHALVGLLGFLGLGGLLTLLSSLLECLLGSFQRFGGFGFAGLGLGFHLGNLLFGHGLGHLGELLGFGLLSGLLGGLGVLGGFGHGLGLLSGGFGLSRCLTGFVGIGGFGFFLCGLGGFGKFFGGLIQGRCHVFGFGVLGLALLGGLLKGLLGVLERFFNFNASGFVGFLHLGEHFLSHGLGSLGELLGFGGHGNGIGIFGQRLFEGFGKLLLVFRGVGKILLGVLEGGLGNTLQFGLHGRVVLKFFLEFLEGFGGGFIDELHQLLQGGVLFIELFLDAEGFLLGAEIGPGFFGFTVLDVFIVTCKLLEGFGEFALMTSGGGEGALLIFGGVSLGGGFQRLFGFARRFLQHSHGVIGVALAFASFFLTGILRIGITAQGFFHAFKAIVDGFLLVEEFFGFLGLGLGIFGYGLGDFVGLFFQAFDGFGEVAQALGEFGGRDLKGFASGGQIVGGLGAGFLEVALQLIQWVSHGHEGTRRLRLCGDGQGQ